VGEVCRGGGGFGGRCTYAQGIVAKSTRAHKEGEGSVFAIFLHTY
jgi:hypothetical protein